MKRTFILLVLGCLIGAAAVNRAQDVSSGGAFLPLENTTVSGQWTFRGTTPIRFEGDASLLADDAFELILSVPDVTADVTATVPNGDNASYAFFVSALTTNNVEVVNSIWGVSNGLRFEGATADAFELTLSPANVGADVTVTIPGGADAAYAFLVSTLTTNDVEVANSVWGASNGLTFEGATANAGQLFLTVADIATASRTMTLPDMGAASAVLATTLTTNTVGAANAVWGVSNGLTFEGATADAGELFLTVANIATASRTMTLPDMGAASAILATTLTTNAPDVANSVWGVSNGIAFGGLTGADGFELTLSPADVGADRAVTIPDMGAASALVASTLTTNTVDAANSVWFASNAEVWEGTTANTEEITFQIADVTADLTINWRNDPAGTYHPLTQITADVTGGHFLSTYLTGDTSMTMADNTMYVFRIYIPTYLTIANTYIRGAAGADTAAADDILGVALFEDADAGTQLFEVLSTDFAGEANQTLNNADVTVGPGFYRLGVCSGDASGIAFFAQPTDDDYEGVVNGGTVVQGTAANACTADGNPPTTTGAITTADVDMPVLKFGA